MKKIGLKLVFMLAIVFGSMNFAAAQGFEIQDKQKVHDFYPTANDPMDCYIHFKNLKKTNMVFGYKSLLVDYPMFWDVSFCDNKNCYATFKTQDTMAVVSSNMEASLKITVFPNGKAGVAKVQYIVFDYENPTDFDTVTWNINVRWGADTKTWITEAVQVYPNPVVDVLNVSALGDVAFDVVDSKGAVVKHVVPVAGRMDVSELAAGMYFVRCQSVDKVQTISFVKK
jgi:hypothetical protein